MIISKIKGDLSDQLFRWAYGKHISLKYNEPHYADINFYRDLDNKVPFYLFDFPDLNLITNINYDDYRDFTIYNVDEYSKIQKPDGFGYFLNGDFRSGSYFKESSNIIKGLLKPSKWQLDKILQTPLLSDNSISIHIDRETYNREYYLKALELIGDYDYLFIFSDDIEWCKFNIDWKNSVFMEFNKIESLHLISLMKRNITSNDFFSWWASYLNWNNNPTIITPLLDVPENWIKLA